MNERKVPAWMLEAKPRRKVVMVAREPLSEWYSIKYVRRFIRCMTFWGFIAVLSSSSLPLALGLFFFFSDEAFIEWVFLKIGIRFVPDTLGPEFIKAFALLFGIWVLLVHWRDSAPNWLAPRLPPDGPWFATFPGFAVLPALAIAVVKTGLMAVARKLLSQFELTPDQDWAILGLRWLGVSVAFGLLAWFGSH